MKGGTPAAGWPAGTAGVLVLPSGRRIRGRPLRRSTPTGLQPTFGLYLRGRPPPAASWEAVWLHWPDFWLPRDRGAALGAIRELHRRALTERVEVACGGGVGRTGTVLACCAVLDGLAPDSAVEFVRDHYHRRAVELPWQRNFVRLSAPGTV